MGCGKLKIRVNYLKQICQLVLSKTVFYDKVLEKLINMSHWLQESNFYLLLYCYNNKYSDRSYYLMRFSPVSILRKSISGRHRPVRVADGPMTARCRFT